MVICMSKLVNEYIASLYSNENIITKEYFEENTSIKSYCPVIDTSVARFLKIIIKCIKPENVLELGTSIGYSTTIIAKTIAEWGGKVTTIELDPEVSKAARLNFFMYNVEKSISLINNDAFIVMPKLDCNFDIVFLDLYNGLYPDILEHCINVLKPGGILLADDTLFPVLRDSSVYKASNIKVHKFNEMICNRSDVESILLPFDDGITIAIKSSE